MVGRRLAPAVLALVLAFTPAALQLCQASCLSHAEPATPEAGSAHHHHAAQATRTHVHHDVLPPVTPLTAAVAMTSGPHACNHVGELPTLTGAVQNTFAAPAVAVPVVDLPVVQAPQIRTPYGASANSPERIALTTQLRV